jgi:DNA-binding response OmpR family regulator
MAFKIVIIDDDRVTLRLLEKTLADEETEVLSAGDGGEGWKLIQEHRPALVISDMLIPKIHGIELVRLLKEDPVLSETKVILMSAVYKSLPFKKDIHESGADFFIEKPLDMEKLKGYIKKIFS